MIYNLHNLASTIGWEIVNVDEGFVNYEYVLKIGDIESLSYIVRISDNPTEEYFSRTFEALIQVLPKKFQKKLYKLIKNSNVKESMEIIIFAVDEYRQKTDFYKLYTYGLLLGVDLYKEGYAFEYVLSKKEKTKILARIEQELPMELAPVLGKIKKLDYKIGYLKHRNSTIIK